MKFPGTSLEESGQGRPWMSDDRRARGPLLLEVSLPTGTIRRRWVMGFSVAWIRYRWTHPPDLGLQLSPWGLAQKPKPKPTLLSLFVQ